MKGEGCSHLQLLQLPDVGVTLQLQIPHLVLVFLVLMQTLVFLPLFFLTGKLNQSTKTPSLGPILTRQSETITRDFLLKGYVFSVR